MIEEFCFACLRLIPLSDLPVAVSRSDGRGSYCRSCMKERSKASYRKRMERQGKTVRELPPLSSGTRRCPDCVQVLPLEDFPRSKNQRSGRDGYCKPCHSARGKANIAARGGSRQYHLVARYGITAAEADAMVEEQGGLCAVCHERPAAHVDHDHTFGNVRGVLCFTCNGGLGQFQDRTDILRNAIDYLERTTWQRTLVTPGVYRLTSPRPAAARSATSSA